MSDKRPSYIGVTGVGPLPTPLPPLPNGDDEPQTNPGMPVSAGYVKAKLEEASTEAQRRTWFAGWAAGIAGVGAAVILAFGGWFRIEAMAQEKADRAVKDAGSAADAKMGDIRTDIAVLKTDVAEVKKAQEKQSDKQDEMLRLLKARR